VSEIKRTGPPSARDVKGKTITWTLPLSAMPDKEWRKFFVQTRDTTVVCNPRSVAMYQGLMVFESVEDDVPTWISFIDKWMAAANARYAEWEGQQRRLRGDDADPRDRDRKLRDLNEKFKDL
jgi:hypothetical protein